MFPHSEQLATDAVIYFYFMAEDLVKAFNTRTVTEDTLKAVRGGDG